MLDPGFKRHLTVLPYDRETAGGEDVTNFAREAFHDRDVAIARYEAEVQGVAGSIDRFPHLADPEADAVVLGSDYVGIPFHRVFPEDVLQSGIPESHVIELGQARNARLLVVMERWNVRYDDRSQHRLT